MATSQCCDHPPTADPACGKGKVVDNIGGLKAYISGSFDASKPTILLVSDVFGFDAPNLRSLADKVAQSGFYVVVPDFLYGDPMTNDFSQFSQWIQKHGPAKGFEDAKLVIQALKEKGVSSIGAAGFCWGAKVAVELAKSHDFIKAAVLLHPSFVTVQDIQEVKCPISILGAEIDRTTPPEVTKQFEELLSTKPEVESYVKIFGGVAHGWTVRYEANDTSAVAKAEEAHKDLLDWFVKYVK